MRYFFSLPFDTCCFPTCSCNLRLSLAPPLHCQLFWLCTTPRAFSTGPKVQRHPLLCAAYPVWTLCCTNMRSIPLQLQLNYTNKGREDNTTHNPSSSFILSICLFSHHPKSSLGVSVRSLLPITLCPPSLFFSSSSHLDVLFCFCWASFKYTPDMASLLSFFMCSIPLDAPGKFSHPYSFHAQ